MTTLLLDTHILLWWRLYPHLLSRAQARALEGVTNAEPAAISSITIWELAKAVARGRIVVPGPTDIWLEQMEAHPMVMVLPLTARIAIESTRLGVHFPRDPADQIIAATARCHGLKLLTADERIRTWGKVQII